ncbi:hypothetical protein [Sphingomonas sp.]|uniref:hypothetical protein n=1 Tax=Sphingomonas sp. TaxID=28214 RepID=UPI0025CBC9DF|nr:hypothetical protein [Sphingomonas sp.]
MMLRNVLLVITLAWLAIGAWAALMFGAWPMLVFPAIVAAGIVFERFRYQGNASDAAPGDWRPTNERFLDEETGRPVVVWFNPTTGERKYVDD